MNQIEELRMVKDAEIAELGKRIAEIEKENKKLKGFIEDIAERDCQYGDGCPLFIYRGRCDSCKAKEVLKKGGE